MPRKATAASTKYPAASGIGRNNGTERKEPRGPQAGAVGSSPAKHASANMQKIISPTLKSWLDNVIIPNLARRLADHGGLSARSNHA